jgi:hypothetical protein
MIELSEALTLHQLLIDQFGGRSGLRDQGASMDQGTPHQEL